MVLVDFLKEKRVNMIILIQVIVVLHCLQHQVWQEQEIF